MDIELTPVGYVKSSRSDVRDDDWDRETTSIALDERVFTAEAVRGLEAFSHIEVIYFFDRVAPERIERGARRPRGNPDWPPVGIFAQRGKNRPNRLGVTIARLVGVRGTTIDVTGLDAVDGTPVVDIKPHMVEFAARGDVHQPRWATELMRDYWIPNSPDPSRDLP